MRIPYGSCDGLDLHSNRNYQREYMISKGKYKFKFIETEEPLKEVELWLREHNLD